MGYHDLVPVIAAFFSRHCFVWRNQYSIHQVIQHETFARKMISLLGQAKTHGMREFMLINDRLRPILPTVGAFRRHSMQVKWLQRSQHQTRKVLWCMLVVFGVGLSTAVHAQSAPSYVTEYTVDQSVRPQHDDRILDLVFILERLAEVDSIDYLPGSVEITMPLTANRGTVIVQDITLTNGRVVPQLTYTRRPADAATEYTAQVIVSFKDVFDDTHRVTMNLMNLATGRTITLDSTTVPTGDTTPPSVDSVTIGGQVVVAGSEKVRVPVGSLVEIAFTEPVDFDASDIGFLNASRGATDFVRVSATQYRFILTNSVTIVPTGVNVTITISSVRDRAGNNSSTFRVPQIRLFNDSSFDSVPHFATGASVSDQEYTVGTEITPLELPEAFGGDGPLTYSLTPNLTTATGLNFDADSRTISGTPTTAGTNILTYTVTDSDADTDTLTFNLSVIDQSSPDTPPPPPVISTAATTVTEAMFTIEGTVEAGATVEVFRAGTSIGMAIVTGTDWSLEVTLNEGSNILTATASDAGGTSAASAQVTITLDTTAPAVPIITTTATTVGIVTFTIAGTAEDGATVELFRGGTSIGTTTVTGTDWSLEVELNTGINTITARASDVAGNRSAASTAVTITRDVVPPTVVITTTATTTATAAFTIAGTTEAGATVFLGRVPFGTSLTTVATMTGNWTFDVILNAGSNRFSVNANDVFNNTSTPVEVVITLEVPPAPVISTSSATIATDTFTIAGTATAGATIQLLRNGTEEDRVTLTSSEIWSFNVTLTEGNHVFTAIAQNVVGESNESLPITITVDLPPDAPRITTTAITVMDAAFTIKGEAEAGATVELFRGTDSLGTITATPSDTWSLEVTLDEGNNDITATATDAGGTSAASTPVTITLDSMAPAVPVISTTATTVMDTTFTIAGTAEAGATVELFRVEGTGMASVGMTNTGTGTDWSLEVTLVEGANEITATASDVAGNRSVASTAVTITLDTTAPAVPIITTTAETVSDSTFTIEGTAEAGATVELFRDGTSIAMATITGTDWTFNVTLNEGSNILTATATDVAGNRSAASAQVTITLDSTAPAVPVISTAATTVSNSTFTIAGTAEAGATVQLFRGGNSLGTTTVTGTSWSREVTLVNGANEITARATDVAGNRSAASTAVTITLDSTAPDAPSITTAATTVMDAMFTIAGTAEAGATVQLFRGGNSLGTTTVTGTSWSREVTLVNGANEITARATDVAGNRSAASTAVTITLDTTAPDAPSITTAATTVMDAMFTIAGTAEAGATVELFRGGNSLGTTTVTGTSWSREVTLVNGANEITARATDVAGNRSAASTAVTITLDSTAPDAPSITTAATTVMDATFTIAGTAEAGATVELFRGGSSLGTTTVTGTSWSLDVTLVNGANEITARATDVAGNRSAASTAVTITLDSTAPAVPIITTAATTVSDSTFIIRGTAEAGATVELFRGGNSLGTTTVTGTSWSREVTLVNGANEITARATDVAGNRSAASTAVTITLDTTAPDAPSITTAATTVTDATFTIAGTAEAGATVELFRGGNSLGTTTVTGTTWSLDVTLVNGANEITARATDVAGNRSAASTAVTITLDSTAPAVPIITTAATTVSDSTFIIRGTAEAGATVELFRVGAMDPIAMETITGTDWSLEVTLVEGANIITARATAGGGTAVFSNSVFITLDTTPPALAVTTMDTTTATARFTIAGRSGAGATVEVFRSGSSLGTTTVTGTDWTFDVTLNEGSNILTATATDAVGNVSALSSAVTITLDSTAPAVPVISTTATTVMDATFTIAGTAEAGATVELFRSGSSLGMTTVTGTSWSLEVTLVNGANEITARATDVAGNRSAASTAVTITLDSTAPDAPSITTAATTVMDATFTIAGTAEAGATVQLFRGGNSLGTATVTGTSWSREVTLVNGANEITARATDVAGNRSAASTAVTITLDTTPPAVPVITTAATTVSDSTFTIAGTAEAGATVEVFRSGTSIGTTTVTGTSWTRDVTLVNGANEITARATDAAGNRSAASAPVTITLSAPGPIITTAATTVMDATFTIAGTAGAGATEVELFRVGTADPLATPTVTGGNWSAAVTLVEGPNIITAIGIDAGGNRSAASAPVTITLDSTAPAVPVITTAATTVMDATFTIAGTAEAGATVEVFNMGSSGSAISLGTTTFTGTDWTFDVTLDEGTNAITARASDAVGNESAASNAVTITLDSTVPAVPVITTTDTMTRTSRFTIAGEAEAGATVELFRSGASLGTTTVTGTTWSLEVTLEGGANIITATATDAAGNESTASGEITITVSDPIAAPVITTTATTVMDAMFTIEGEAEAGATVELFRVVGTTMTSLGTTTFMGTDWTFDVTLDEGANDITATATDAAGNESPPSSEVTITRDTTAPAVPVITTAATTVMDATFTIAGTAGSDTATVEVFRAGIDSLGTTTVTGTDWTIDVTLVERANDITATATDATGNESVASTAVTITLDSVPPTVMLTRIRPAGAGATVTVNVSIPIQVVFSERVSGFTEEDVTVSGAGGSIVSFSNYADRGTYTFLVRPSEAGTLTVNIGADVVNDRAGNGNGATTPLEIPVMSAPVDAPTITLMDSAGEEVDANETVFIRDVSVYNMTGSTAMDSSGGTIAVTTTITDSMGNAVSSIDQNQEGSYFITYTAGSTPLATQEVVVDNTEPQVSDTTTASETFRLPSTNAAGNTITLPTDEPVLVPLGIDPMAFSITTTVNGTNTVTHTVASVTAGSIVLNGVSPPIRPGAMVTVGYTPPPAMMITDRAGNPLATLTRTVIRIVAASSSNAAIKQLNEAILSDLTQAVIASTAVSVERRVNVMLSSDTPQTASYQLDGQTVQLDGRTSLSASFQDTLLKKLPSHNRSLQDGTMDWKRMLSKSSFVLPLDATSGSNVNFDRALSMWASSDYTKLGGDGATDWDGSVFGVQLGLDGRVREDMLLGGMISWSEGDVDYTQGNEKGRYQHQVTSIHPYLAWAEDEVDLWGSVGYGQGKLEIKAEGESLRSSDTKLLSLAAGGKQALSRAGSSLKSDILLATTRIGQSTTIDADNIASQRLRLLLEIGQERRSASGLFTPLLEVGVRYDGGDGATGMGVVLGAGLRHVNPVAGVTLEGRLHTLLGRSDYNEWGIQGLVRLQAGANEQRGLSFSLSPSYGHSGTSDASAMWQQNLSASTNDDDYHVRMDADISYGLLAPGGRGLLTPYSAITLGNSSDRYRLGLRWKRNARLEMNLFGEEQADNHKVLLEGRLRF